LSRLSFPRTRESSVFAQTSLGPRVRGDDERFGNDTE